MTTKIVNENIEWGIGGIKQISLFYILVKGYVFVVIIRFAAYVQLSNTSAFLTEIHLIIILCFI